MHDTDLDPETCELVEQLQAAFADVVYDGPAPRTHSTGKRVALAAGIPALVAAGVATVLMLGVSGATPQPVWAAEPNPPDPQTEATAVEACKAATQIDDGFADADWSPDVFDSRGTSTLTVIKTVVPPPGEKFRPAGMAFRRACLATSTADGTPVMSEMGVGGDPGLAALHFETNGVNAWAAFGPLLPGAVRVELRVDAQPPVVASIVNGSFAAWWDESVTGELVQLSATGEVLRRESIPLDGGNLPVRRHNSQGDSSRTARASGR